MSVLRSCVLIGVLGAARCEAWTVIDPGQGPVALDGTATGARELSGLAWAGGEQYYAVSDGTPMLYGLRIAVDARGTIRSAVLDSGVRLRGSDDVEGIALLPGGAEVLISDEVGAAIRRYPLAGGLPTAAVAVPTPFHTARKNHGFEALSLSPDGATLWAANEEALACDGAPASFERGSAVRLLRLTVAQGGAAIAPAAQYAYVTDPIPGDVRAAGRDVEASGVSDLVALPDGALLVLERAYGAAGTRSRLYAVDFTAASDCAALAALSDGAFTPVRKRLLWERVFADANFEGAALGPPLAAGGRSLLLIADDGHALRQALYALVLRPQ